MTRRIKLAVLGGSSVATPELIRALSEHAARPPMEVVLLGRTGHKLEGAAFLAARN
jgi:hypothetical protein